MFKKRQKYYKPDNLENQIPGSHALTWNVPFEQSLSRFIFEVKSMFLSAMTNCTRVRRNQEKIEAIQQAINKIGPASIDFIKYKRGKRQGASWHQDSYSVFGTAVCILQDTTNGRLHIDGFDIPEDLKSGDVILMDPTCLHQVHLTSRGSDRDVGTVQW